MQIEVSLGIDIGGTNTKFGLVDHQGKVYVYNTIDTKAEQAAEKLFQRLFINLNRLLNQHPDELQIRAVGIGAPNANHYTGRLEYPPNLSWDIVDLPEIVHDHLDLPVAVTNDANAAALGEMVFGNAKGMKNFILITLGTGVGSGIIVNGELVYGHDGFAGEMGHVIVERNGRKCGCGRLGCLEAYTSASGVVRTVKTLLADSDKPSELRDIPIDTMTAHQIYNAAKNGDTIGIEAFDTTARYLGEAMADAAAYFSPEAFFLAGGVAQAGEFIFEPIKRYLEANLFGIFKNKIKILPSGLPINNSAILGASALAWHELEA